MPVWLRCPDRGTCILSSCNPCLQQEILLKFLMFCWSQFSQLVMHQSRQLHLWTCWEKIAVYPAISRHNWIMISVYCGTYAFLKFQVRCPSKTQSTWRPFSSSFKNSYCVFFLLGLPQAFTYWKWSLLVEWSP